MGLLLQFFVDYYYARTSKSFCCNSLFGVYLTYDTQDILKKYDCDNAFDSLLIYIDIARLFLTILAMLGKSRKK